MVLFLVSPIEFLCFFLLAFTPLSVHMRCSLVRLRIININIIIFVVCSLLRHFILSFIPSSLFTREVPPSALRNRLLLHASHRLGDHEALLKYHSDLKPRLEDQVRSRISIVPSPSLPSPLFQRKERIERKALTC